MKFLTVAEACPLIGEARMEVDIRGWHSEHAIFAHLMAQLKPEVIIEVGSYLGASAIHMAGLTRDFGTKIYCVDTWLGDPSPHPANKEPIRYDVGQLYRQFCFNVTKSGFADRIYPVPQTSAGAAVLLHHHGIRASGVYVDGDHSYEGCYADLNSYYPLLLDGGIVWGDDFEDFPSVRMAVSRFGFENNLKVAHDGPMWLLLEPSAVEAMKA